MKIIFLDIDGVLNSAAFFKKMHNVYVCPDDKLDPEAIHRLNKIVDTTKASIVLSSTWRIAWRSDLPGLQSFFKKNNIHGDVLGITPINSNNRGAQIEEWIDCCQDKIESFIIIDDNDDMGRLSKYLVQTSIKDGLQDNHVRDIISKLQ